MRKIFAALLLAAASFAPTFANAGALCSTVSMPTGSFCDAIILNGFARVSGNGTINSAGVLSVTGMSGVSWATPSVANTLPVYNGTSVVWTGSPTLTSATFTTDVRPDADGGADLGTSALHWATTFTNAISGNGDAGRTWGLARNGVSNTAGGALAINAAGATVGATNKNGGQTIVAAGVSTGTGVGTVSLNCYGGFAAATTDNTAYACGLFAPSAIVFRANDNGTAWQFLENVNGNSRFAFNIIPSGALNGAGGYPVMFDNDASVLRSGISQRLGHLHMSNLSGTTLPGISACGTTPSAARGTDTSGEVTTGTTATGCTITFGTAFAVAPTCNVASQTQLAAFAYTISGSGIVVTQTSTSNNKINWTCVGS